MLPLITKSVFGRGGGSYGGVTSAMGVGALAGALLLASRARPSRRLLVGGAFAFGVITVALALAPGYYAGLAILVLIGAAAVLFTSTTNALLQLNAADAMRGRVMALWSVVFLGSTPFGGPSPASSPTASACAGRSPSAASSRWPRRRGAAALRHRRVVEDGTCEAPVCLPDGPAGGDALGEAIEVGSPRAGAASRAPRRRPLSAAARRRRRRDLKSAAALPM